MNETTNAIIGISLGIVIVVGVQVACYKFIAYEDYPKAIVIALSATLLGILAILLLISIAK